MTNVYTDSVFLFGSGAVEEDAWKPIIAAIQEHQPQAAVQDGPQANHYLTWWVYGQRLRALRTKKGGLSAETKAQQKQLKDADRQLRRKIAEHLSRATTERTYRLRRRFLEVVEHSRWRGSAGVLYLTTNWDNLLEVTKGLSSKSVVHIHGDVTAPDCIYLPSETSHEAHRSRETNVRIGLLTGTAWQVIRDTRQLCIYGLSLSPLDAELSWIVQVGVEAHTRESLRIHLFDLRAELTRLEWRVRLLLPPGSNIEVEKHAVDDDAPQSW